MKAQFVLFLALPAFAARIPAGTELSVRLTTKVASEAPVSNVAGVVIAPVILEAGSRCPRAPCLRAR